MSEELLILMAAAASIGFFHTLLGPDHYLPFIVMSRSGQWTLRKTVFVTTMCGIGHVLSSVVLGITGVMFGIGISRLKAVESFRGEIAAWILLTFGLLYFAWGITRALRNKSHAHIHGHSDGVKHLHDHNHTSEHMHVHKKQKKASFSPWALFIIFILGPCEPLIPVLMYPAAKNSLFALTLVTLIFGTVTVLTMIGAVLVSYRGMNLIPYITLERYTHAIAGAIISFCGVSILFLGL